jgi:hypothetical protein
MVRVSNHIGDTSRGGVFQSKEFCVGFDRYNLIYWPERLPSHRLIRTGLNPRKRHCSLARDRERQSVSSFVRFEEKNRKSGGAPGCESCVPRRHSFRLAVFAVSRTVEIAKLRQALGYASQITQHSPDCLFAFDLVRNIVRRKFQDFRGFFDKPWNIPISFRYDTAFAKDRAATGLDEFLCRTDSESGVGINRAFHAANLLSAALMLAVGSKLGPP